MTKTAYFYLPIAYYDGRILKCAGIADDSNREWFTAEHPNAVELDSYRGDRIHADNYKEFKG